MMAEVVPEVGRRFKAVQAEERLKGLVIGGYKLDEAKVHTNPKLKSGYEGVFGNAAGFRAMARHPCGKTVYVGIYQSALEAAWARYVHHARHKWPYGPWSEYLVKYKLEAPHLTTEAQERWAAYCMGSDKVPGREIGIPDKYMNNYNGELPEIHYRTDVPRPDDQDIASINERLSRKAKEIREKKKQLEEASKASKASKETAKPKWNGGLGFAPAPIELKKAGELAEGPTLAIPVEPSDQSALALSTSAFKFEDDDEEPDRPEDLVVSFEDEAEEELASEA